MNTKTIATISAIVIIFGSGIATARPNYDGNYFWNGMMGSGMIGSGMMGSGMMGSGMMGSGMMGQTGICGNYGSPGNYNYANPITIEQAKASVESYLSATGNADLQVAEVIEFNNHFYASIKEKSTGKYAFELLVNRYTGSVYPENGPNMMWNTKYGRMNLNTQGTNALSEKQAVEIATNYLERALPGTEVEGADEFYGYYTFEVKKDGGVYGMLSVNANNGAIWYHNWHGNFIKILEVE